MATVSQQTLNYFVKLYKLPANSTWGDVLVHKEKITRTTVPCNTNATTFDYSPKMTDEKIIFEMRTAIEREKKRRAVNWDYVPYSSWKPVKELVDKSKVDSTKVSKEYKFNSDAVQELIDRINALGSFQVQNRELYNVGNIIKKTDLKALGRTINQNEIMCLCDCNYCTCDCNYCTCDCNYCTCDCNYSDSVIKSTYFGLTQNYGKIGNIKGGKTNTDDKTNWDKSETTTNATIWSINYCTCDCNYCTCDCNYCTCDCNYQTTSFQITKAGKVVSGSRTGRAVRDYSKYAYGSRAMNGQVYSYCTCDCNYCTCDCNYCTCDCNYCTCDCNYCTCDCNYCTCDCNQCVTYYYGRCTKWDK